MLEVTMLSLLVGNLGWQALGVSGWLCWRQIATSQQHQEEEEEILTSFDLQQDVAAGDVQQHNGKLDPKSRSNQVSTDPQLVGWEFKIVRARHKLFRNPAVFQKLCNEEALSGWMLLEKLDDRRVRFKRPIALRHVLDVEQLSYDPYRCHYGSSFTLRPCLYAIAALMAIVIPSYLGYTIVSGMISQAKTPPPSPYEQIPPQDFPPRN